MWRRASRMLFSAILLLSTVGPPAFAQSPITNYPAGWNPIGATVTLSVTGASSNVQLGWATLNPPAPLTPANAQVCNTGTVNASILFGKSDVTATTANYVVLAGACPLMALNGAQYIAAISNPSGTTSLTISTGNGSASNSSSPGGGAAPGNCGGIPCMPLTGVGATAGALQNIANASSPFKMYWTPAFTGFVQNFQNILCVGQNTCSAAVHTGATGEDEVGFGHYTLAADISGKDNTAIGDHALAVLTTGIDNTAVGSAAASNITSGQFNTALGVSAMQNASTPTNSTAVGASALQSTSGANNTAVGLQALFSATSGSSNTALGNMALYDVIGGGSNTAAGVNTGGGITSGSNNTILGANVTGLPAGLTGAVILAAGDGSIRADYNYTYASTWEFSGDQIVGGWRIGAAAAPVTWNGHATYLTNGYAAAINNEGDGSIAFYTSVSGTAGNPISFVKQMAILNTGGIVLPNLATSGTIAGSACITSAGLVLYESGINCFASASGAQQTITYQPGLLTAINSTQTAFVKFVKASTVDNIIGSASTFSCVSNPTVTLTDTTTSTIIGTVTVTASGAAFAGTISSAGIAAGDVLAWATTSGTCASIDIAATAQAHQT